MAIRILAAAFLATRVLATPQPEVTAAARLSPRQANDPALVGYISASGGFSDVRSCDYPQTLSTSGSYAQCCPSSGACAFYTTCSGNTLIGGTATVPCDFDGTLNCNTGVVKPTAGAAGGASYLACWQKTLGSSPFTFVRDIGTAAAAAPSSTGSSMASNTGSAMTTATTSSGASSSGSTTSTSGGSVAVLPTAARSSTTSASSSSSTGGAGTGMTMGSSGGVVGLLAFLAQMLV